MNDTEKRILLETCLEQKPLFHCFYSNLLSIRIDNNTKISTKEACHLLLQSTEDVKKRFTHYLSKQCYNHSRLSGSETSSLKRARWRMQWDIEILLPLVQPIF